MGPVVRSVLALLGATGVAVAAWVLAASLRPGMVALALIALVAFLGAGYALLGLAWGAATRTPLPEEEAFRFIPPAGGRRADPVVSLHGGPGIPILPTLPPRVRARWTS